MALTTATAVAMSGTAVAGAQTTETNAPLASSSDSLFGSNDGAAEETTEEDDTTTEPAGSADSFFGWDADTTPLEKLKDAFGVITVIGSAIGAIVALASNIDKLIKLFPAQ